MLRAYSMDLFSRILQSHQLSLKRAAPRILQLNIGKLCNLTCIHCHVSAGPRRKEIITRDTVDRLLPWFERSTLDTLDLTGGAPEMIPDFRYIIEQVRGFDRHRHIIDRCNLTILLEKGYDWLGAFLAEHDIEIVASMPCYSPDNVEEQRGHGVFNKSIEALQLLNDLGYGHERSLHLVYNPNGAFLPPAQAELEADYKREMKKHFGIEFHHLYTVTNLPIARFAKYLKRENEYENYMSLLLDAFNPAIIDGLMCRDTINVSWLGEVFDCDFNQMMKLHVRNEHKQNLFLWDLDPAAIEGHEIRTGEHCFGCTAGYGSSCGGSLTEKLAS